MPTLYTIGHSTRTIHQFIKILLENQIHCLVDVRSYPGSTREPQFNKSNLAKSLAKYDIEYYHIQELGGRRHNKSSIDTSIKVEAFSSYAAYMRTPEFKAGIAELKKIATKCRTAIMCSEAVWWRCHRRMIADRMTFDGWDVYHLGIRKEPVLHEIWTIARLDKNGDIVYDQ